MKTYTIQFSAEPSEVEIHQFLAGLGAALTGDSSFRVHGADTQRGTLIVDDVSDEDWVEEQMESSDLVETYSDDSADSDDYILTDSTDGWSVRDGSGNVFWPSSKAETAGDAMMALDRGEGEWRN